ncbi:TonB-dependent siderophore receptor [Methylobacillus glycogenes]|uniref:TonB-dependent siderophore receptor n=1 Tax=Methylobacillus glycogenes TaxID=406 RepID=UPI000AE3BB3E|nr:TonB-dependent siderophore receptor [Methylobacillus glycogenes]
MKQSSLVMRPKLVCMLVAAMFAMPASADDAVLPEVSVKSSKQQDEYSSYAVKNSKGATKTDTALVETPQSISVIDRKELEDRNPQTLNEAIAYTAGVRSEVGGMDSRADSYSIRGIKGGMEADAGISNLFQDGLKLPAGGMWNRATFDNFGLERVEVLKGPSAAVYGQITPGGMINLVSKRPTAHQINEVRIQGGSFDQYKAAFDIGGSLADDQSVLFRLVGSYNDGGSQIKHNDLERTYFAPSLLWQISDNTSLTLLAQYQRDKGGATFQFLPYYGTVAFNTAIGGRLDRDTFYGDKDWNTYDREQSSVGWEFDHRFNDTWKFHQNLRYVSIENTYKSVIGGQYSVNQAVFPRRSTMGVGEAEGVSVDNQLQADFATGDLKHTVLLGLDAQRFNWQNTRSNGTATSLSLLNPVYTSAGTYAMTDAWRQDADQKQTGAYVQEQAALGQWRFSLGGRYDYFDNMLANGLNNRREGFNDHAFTWRTGAVYLFENGLAPYISYSTSFDPGLMGVGMANNATVKPVQGKQYEAGIKYQPPGSKSMISAAVYELKQDNRMVTSGTNNCPQTVSNNTCYTQVDARTRGVELEAKTQITDQLSLLASYTYMDSEITNSSSTTEIQGSAVPQVSKHMSSLWGNYAFTSGYLDGLSLGLGARYVGDAYGAASRVGPTDNPFLHTDGYTTYDAAVRYNLKSLGYAGAEFAVNASNLTDRLFVTTCTGLGACYYGSGRVVNATLKYNW